MRRSCDAVHSRKNARTGAHADSFPSWWRILVLELEGPLFFGTAEKLAAAIKILANLGRELGARLRRANRTIQELAT